jgi:hypothetical protein
MARASVSVRVFSSATEETPGFVLVVVVVAIVVVFAIVVAIVVVVGGVELSAGEVLLAWWGGGAVRDELGISTRREAISAAGKVSTGNNESGMR